MRAYAESSPSIVTPLNRHVGYEAAATIAKQALANGATIRQTVLDLGYVERGELTEAQLDEALDVERMTRSVSGATTYVITGGSDGIGLECASQVAAADPGCRIVLVGRNPDRTAKAVGRIRAEQPSCRVDSLLCDFADQAAVRRLADDLLATCDRIDVLVNNAGTVFSRRTADRRRHRVDVRGQPPRRLPAHGPAPRPARRERAGPGRLHLLGGPLLGDDGPRRPRLRARLLDHEGLRPLQARQRAHRARCSRDRLAGTGVTVTSLHPGAIATNIWSGAPWFARPVLAVLKRWKMETPEVGGSRLAYLATSPEVEGQTGGYYQRNRLREPSAARPRRRARPSGCTT